MSRSKETARSRSACVGFAILFCTCRSMTTSPSGAVAELASVSEPLTMEPRGWSFVAAVNDTSHRHDPRGLVVTMPGGRPATAAYWLQAREFGDVTIGVTTTLLSGDPAQSFCGISFRAGSDRDVYRFLVDGEGYYRLSRRVHDVPSFLTEWTHSNAIRTGIGAENRLQVIARGSRISVYANSTRLVEVVDTTFSRGCVGLQMQRGDSRAEPDVTQFALREVSVTSP